MKPRQPLRVRRQRARRRCQLRPRRACRARGKMRERLSPDDRCRPRPSGTSGLPRRSRLVCRNCGARFPLGAQHACSGVFRAPRDRLRPRRAGRGDPRADRRPARSPCGATPDLLPVGQDPQTRVDSGYRDDTPDPGGRAGRGARLHGTAVGEGRLGEPDAQLQGPRRVRRDDGGARARVRADRLRLHRQPGQLGGRARRTHRHAVDRLRPGRPGAGQDRADRGVRRHAGRRRGLLRRRQPAVLGARGDRRVRGDRASSTSTSGRTTRRDRRPSASRSPSSWAGGSRRRWSARWRPGRC